MKKPFAADGTRLPRLDLELLDPDASRRRAGLPVLAAGIVLAIAVATHHLHTARQIAAIETGMPGPAGALNETDKTADNEETKSVRESMGRLALPWGTLFTALEKASVEEIGLISVEPNAETGSVRIVAEAPDVYAMLEYIRALSAQPGFQGVLLESYEAAELSPEQPLRFTLTAVWGSLP